MGTERSTKVTRDSGMTTTFERVPSMFIFFNNLRTTSLFFP
jgi:hypothetical protein